MIWGVGGSAVYSPNAAQIRWNHAYIAGSVELMTAEIKHWGISGGPSIRHATSGGVALDPSPLGDKTSIPIVSRKSYVDQSI